MAGIKYLFGAVLLISLVAVLVIYDGYGGINSSSIPNAFNDFVEQTTKFADGSMITILVKDQPESTKSVPVTKKIITDDNGTKSIVEETVKDAVVPVKGITQYSKSDPNGVVVQGYIILTSAVNGEPIKPYVYDVLVQIECDEELNDKNGFNFCSTPPVFGRVQTEDAGRNEDNVDLGGYFVYKWRPSNTASLSFYDVKIIVTSDQKNSYGMYENYEQSYKIQVLQ